VVSTGLSRDLIIGVTPFETPNPQLAIALLRGGALVNNGLDRAVPFVQRAWKIDCDHKFNAVERDIKAVFAELNLPEPERASRRACGRVAPDLSGLPFGAE